MIHVIGGGYKVVKSEGKDILSFVDQDNYTDSFGYEWKNYPRTYSDITHGFGVSLSRLESLLGFPVEFLTDKIILEAGCGSGRFTEHLVRYAKEVVAVDYSIAIFHNSALQNDKLLAIRADLTKLPKFSQPIDIVYCRGVIQHTEDPVLSIKKLFEAVRPGGLVVFDVYKKTGAEWRNSKYFWRPILKKMVKLEKFDGFIKKHGKVLYAMQHMYIKIVSSIKPLKFVLCRTPFYLSMDWNAQYPQMNKEQRLEIFKNELIDGYYSGYDQPMTTGEVIETLAKFGQRPYSFDQTRNQFRCKFSGSFDPISVQVTKNGVMVL